MSNQESSLLISAPSFEVYWTTWSQHRRNLMEAFDPEIFEFVDKIAAARNSRQSQDARRHAER